MNHLKLHVNLLFSITLFLTLLFLGNPSYAQEHRIYNGYRYTGYQIFAEFIPSGKSELSYELKVVQEGSFANGPAVLSCIYKPEIAAYSNSFVIKTTK